MGGVDINLTSAEARVVGGGAQAGVNHLNGEQALSYARIRKLDSDFGRTERQRRLLSGMLTVLKDMNYNSRIRLMESILPLISTDMTNEEITDYMLRILPILPELEITTQYIPAAGTYQNASIRGMAVLVPDLEANTAILRETLG